MENMIGTVDLTQDDFRDRIGEETSKMRLTDSTRIQYASALDRFKRWLAYKYPELLNEEGNIILPISSSVTTAFMYHAMRNLNDKGEYLNPPEFYSLNYVNAYRNSIKNLYRERKVSIDADLDCVFKDTMSAHKRRRADLKSKGEMSIHEGKQPMSQSGYYYLSSSKAE